MTVGHRKDPTPARRLARAVSFGLGAAVLATAATLPILLAGPAGAHGGTGSRGLVTSLAVTPDAPSGTRVSSRPLYYLGMTSAGHEIVVFGVEDEPYLRLSPDGAVWRNAWAPTWFRYADPNGPVSPAPDPAQRPSGDEPVWVPTRASGELVWHEPRAELPAGAAEHRWAVPLRVDGVPAVLEGTSGPGDPNSQPAAYVVPQEPNRTVAVVLAILAILAIASAGALAWVFTGVGRSTGDDQEFGPGKS